MLSVAVKMIKSASPQRARFGNGDDNVYSARNIGGFSIHDVGEDDGGYSTQWWLVSRPNLVLPLGLVSGPWTSLI